MELMKYHQDLNEDKKLQNIISHVLDKIGDLGFANFEGLRKEMCPQASNEPEKDK